MYDMSISETIKSGTGMIDWRFVLCEKNVAGACHVDRSCR